MRASAPTGRKLMDKAEKKEIRERLNKVMCRVQERIAYCDMVGDGLGKKSESDVYELAWILMQLVQETPPALRATSPTASQHGRQETDSNASLGMTKTEQSKTSGTAENYVLTAQPKRWRSRQPGRSFMPCMKRKWQ